MIQYANKLFFITHGTHKCTLVTEAAEKHFTVHYVIRH